MDKINELEYEQLTKLIEKMIEQKIDEALKNRGVESSFRGKVISVGYPYATVEFSNGGQMSLLNASGSELSEGDNVIVYGSQSNMANRYIGVKLS